MRYLENRKKLRFAPITITAIIVTASLLATATFFAEPGNGETKLYSSEKTVPEKELSIYDLYVGSYYLWNSQDEKVAEIQLPDGFKYFVPCKMYDSNYNATEEVDYSQVNLEEENDAPPSYVKYQVYEEDLEKTINDFYQNNQEYLKNNETVEIKTSEMDTCKIIYAIIHDHEEKIVDYEGGVYDGEKAVLVVAQTYYEDEEPEFGEENYIDLLRNVFLF